MNLKLWQLIKLTVLIGLLNFMTVSCYQPNSSTQGDLIDNNSPEASTPTDNNTSRSNSQGNSDTEQQKIYRYWQTLQLAEDAARKCLSDKELDECDKLSQIENTLIERCGSGDESACETHTTIITMVQAIQIAETIGN